jgi:hypothetical protein
MTRLLASLALYPLLTGAADLASIQAEPNLEKRAGLAMEYAMKRVDAAREAGQAGQVPAMTAVLEEIAGAVELARDSLKQTGKSASKSPKHFKRAEQNAVKLLRRLDSLIQDLSVEDREPAEKTRARVRKVQEALLLDIMGGHRRK